MYPSEEIRFRVISDTFVDTNPNAMALRKAGGVDLGTNSEKKSPFSIIVRAFV